MYNYCFNVHFRREFRTFNESHIIDFKNKYSFFLSPELSTEECYFEFTCFHLHKWIKRLGLKYTAEDTRSFLKEKWSEFAYFA
jgi:hypothetical protein